MTTNYTFKTPIGFIKICEENDNLTSLSLQRGEAEAALSSNSTQHSELLYEAYRQINEYFAGKRKKFELPICCVGTTFQKQVW